MAVKKVADGKKNVKSVGTKTPPEEKIKKSVKKDASSTKKTKQENVKTKTKPQVTKETSKSKVNSAKSGVVTKKESKNVASTKSVDKKVIKVEEKKSVSKVSKPAVKSEKVKKAVDDTSKKEDDYSSNKIIAFFERDTRRLLYAVAGVFVLMFTFIGLICGLRGSAKPLQIKYGGRTQVGYYATTERGTIERNVPTEVKNEGLELYPTYGSTLREVLGSENESKRNALISEASRLSATGTANGGGGGYTWIDSQGFLHNGTTADPQPSTGIERLYKHSASVGMYLGDVSDDEPAIIKDIRIRPRSYSSYYSVTGVYAPAGELIKIQLSEEDMEKTGGIVIHIGQALYNGQANNIWTAKNQMQRMPIILNTLAVTKNTSTLEDGVYTAYVGSFLGGPLYIRDESVEFDVKISGGVAYPHFILGYTTEEEFRLDSKSSAPYFDLEVWDSGVLHSGPRRYVQNYSFEQLYDAAVLWEKVSLVSTRVRNQGVVFIYDPFVAAGAAVAFPGRRSVNCPLGWMSSGLNAEAIINGGDWGNFHEYHHNFQGFGVGDDGEVTNNSLNLVSYTLFTNVSAARGIEGFGGSGLGGWNQYTSATWALNRVNTGQISGTNGLAVYSTLIHNFGQDAYIKSASSRGETYFTNFGNNVQYDMSYFARLVSKFAVGADTYAANLHEAHKEYPMFVPVSCVYQTGRTYKYDGKKKSIDTQRPFVVQKGEDIILDFSKYTVNSSGQYVSGSIVIGGPNETDVNNNIVSSGGFDYYIKKINTSKSNAKLKKLDDYHYQLIPGKSGKTGKIYVTLGIEKLDHEFEVEDVELILEFNVSTEGSKNVLTRNTYFYEEGKGYTDAQEAFNNNYKGYSSVQKGKSLNPVQNSNTDVWYYPDTEENNTEDKKPFVYPKNAITEVNGKIYIDQKGKYRLALRGRYNCAMYVSLDGKNFTLGGYINDNNSTDAFRLNDPNTFTDIEFKEEGWLYFKIVLVVENKNGKISYCGLGIGTWVQPTFRQEEVLDDKGNVIGIKYYDVNNNEVTEDEVNSAVPTEPTSVRYANGLNPDYEFPEGYSSEYFYTREYPYTYNRDIEYRSSASLYADGGCGAHKDYPFTNLFDDDLTNNVVSNAIVTADKPWIFTIDMGKTITANRIVITSRQIGSSIETPKSITLKVGMTPNNLVEVANFDDGVVKDYKLQFNFETQTFRYYQLEIRAAYSNRFASVRNIEFAYNVANGKKYSPDNEMFSFNKSDWKVTRVPSSFGNVFTAKSGKKFSFKFKGAQFALLSSDKYKNRFEVKIDGNKVSSLELLKFTETGVSYLSTPLSNKTHSVEITCLSSVSIDSIVIFS